MRSVRPLWFLALALVLATLVVTRSATLHGTDECREAGMARAMADSGDLVVPRLNGRPFLEKPPLFYAAAAGLVRLLGPTERAVRLASGLLGALAVLAVLGFGRRLSGGMLGATIAAIALGTSYGFIDAAHHCVTNIAVAATVPLALLAFERLASEDRPGLAGPLFYAALALGFLSKNLFGVAVPGVAAVAYALAARDWRALRRLFLTPSWLVFFAIVGPWLFALYQAGEREPPGGQGLAFLREALVANNVGRFVAGFGGHTTYHALQIPEWLGRAVGLWTPLALLAFANEWRHALGADTPERRRRAWILLAWMIAPAVLIAASRSKRPDYMVALTAPWMLAIGAFFEDLARRGAGRAALALTSAAVVVLVVGGPSVVAWQDYQARGAVALPALGLLAAGGLLLAHVPRLVRGRDFERLALLGALGAIAFAAGPLDPAIARAQDEAGEGPFHREVAAIVRGTGELGAIGYGERELGSAYFYLGRTVTDLGWGPPEGFETPVGPEVLKRLAAPLRERVEAFAARPQFAGILLAFRRRGARCAPSAEEAIEAHLGEPLPLLVVGHERASQKRRLVLLMREEKSSSN